MELINLSHFNTDYRNRRDIETALAWNAVKKTLTELGREELFAYIKSVKVTEKNITLMTGKPIVNEELKGFSATLLSNINAGLKTIGSIERMGVKLN